jgi:hypothetical protein
LALMIPASSLLLDCGHREGDEMIWRPIGHQIWRGADRRGERKQFVHRASGDGQGVSLAKKENTEGSAPPGALLEFLLSAGQDEIECELFPSRALPYRHSF